MFLFQRRTIDASVIKAKSDKIKDAALRDAKKQVKNGELTDSHDLALYLSTIDDRFKHLKMEVAHATKDASYAKTRENKMVKTRKLLEFFSQEDAELRGLYEIIATKAKEAGLTEGMKGKAMTTIDISKLKAGFGAI